jgi:hypothetical protein
VTDTDNHDRQSFTPQAIPGPQPAAYRVVVYSIRGHKYLVGNTTVHPVDEIPPGVGTRFTSTSAVQSYVRRELAGLSCYHAVAIVGDDGHTLMRGVRSGFNGTGNTWIWLDIRPGETSAPA